MTTQQGKSSHENVQIAQRLYESFLRRDFNGILAVLSQDVIWAEPANPFNPAGGTRHGHEGFLEWLKVGRDSEDILTLEVKQYLSDTNSVAVVGFTRCRAKQTDRIYETDFVHLIYFNENKIVRFQEFFDTYVAAEAFRTGAD